MFVQQLANKIVLLRVRIQPTDLCKVPLPFRCHDFVVNNVGFIGYDDIVQACCRKAELLMRGLRFRRRGRRGSHSHPGSDQ